MAYHKVSLKESLNALDVVNLVMCFCNGNKGTQKVNYANQFEETRSLFYVSNVVTNMKVNHIWYIDSGCSNQMTGDERLLVNVQRNLTSKVKMGT